MYLSQKQLAMTIFLSAMAVIGAYGISLIAGAWAILIGGVMLFVVWGTVVRFAQPGTSATMEDEGVLLIIVFAIGLIGCWYTISPWVTMAISVIAVLAGIGEMGTKELDSEKA
jgi:hypothetical protein